MDIQTATPVGGNNINTSIKEASEDTSLRGKRHVRMILLSMGVGVITGFATWVMGTLIRMIGKFFTSYMHPDGSNWLFLFLPIAGIFLTMIWQRYIVRRNVAHGTTMIKRHIHNGQYRLDPSLMYASIVGCSLTVGFGGSAGAEGPSAYTGAAIGSNVARWLRLPDHDIRLMLVVGAGAGIAGIFRAPVGGVLFVLEVLGVGLRSFSVILLILGCLVAYVTAFLLSGMKFDLPFHSSVPFELADIAWVALLGLCCGLYSLWYRFVQERTKRYFERQSNQWVKALLSGSMLAMSIFFFPVLFGEGYDVVDRLVNGDGSVFFRYSPFSGDYHSISILVTGTAAILLLKGALVSCSNCGGGVAGDFAPTLFAGCIFGYMFGYLVNLLFGAGISPAHYALIGMSATMGGIILAPLTAIFITAEMSGAFPFALGFMIATGVSYLTVCLLRPGLTRLETDLAKWQL